MDRHQVWAQIKNDCPGYAEYLRDNEKEADLILELIHVFGKIQIHATVYGGNMTTRTNSQNAAMHVYFTETAKALNEAGYGVKKFFTEVKKVEIDWSEGQVKENIWKPIQAAMTEKYSTTELDTKEVDVVYEQVNRVLSEIGIFVPFPSEEEMMMADRLKNG